MSSTKDNIPVRGKRYKIGTDAEEQAAGLEKARAKEVEKAKETNQEGGEFDGEKRPKQAAIERDEKTLGRLQEYLNKKRNDHKREGDGA